jgi:hypothetical protein
MVCSQPTRATRERWTNGEILDFQNIQKINRMKEKKILRADDEQSPLYFWIPWIVDLSTPSLVPTDRQTPRVFVSSTTTHHSPLSLSLDREFREKGGACFWSLNQSFDRVWTTAGSGTSGDSGWLAGWLASWLAGNLSSSCGSSTTTTRLYIYTCSCILFLPFSRLLLYLLQQQHTTTSIRMVDV